MAPLERRYTPLPIASEELPFEFWRFQAAVDSDDLTSLRLYFNATPNDFHHVILGHRDGDNLTLFLRAVHNGHLDLVRYLTEELGASSHAFHWDDDYESYHAIHMAADLGHLEILRYLLDASPALIDLLDSEDNTVLHRAAQYGQLAVVKYLVEEKQCDITEFGEAGNQPIHLAASWGFLETVQYLVEKGADVTSKDSELERTPLHWAVCGNHVEIVRYLAKLEPRLLELQDSNGYCAIHIAAEANHIASLKVLIEECGDDCDRKARDDWTPLASAIAEKDLDNIDAIRYLIEKGANLTVRVTEKQQPLLQLAVDSKRMDVFEELLARRPDLYLLKNGSGTALFDYINELAKLSKKRRREDAGMEEDL